MNKRTIGIIILAATVITWNFTVAYVDKQLQENRDLNMYNSCHKVWASRGLYSDWYDKNSIKSMQSAFLNGARGVEVDFYYDSEMDRFIVSHDRPFESSDGTLVYTKKNGKLLTMEKLLETVGEGHYFWLDYKNLDRMSAKEIPYAIERLLSITQKGTIRKRLYIEGSNPLRLSIYTDAGFKTILGIHPLSESNPFSSIVINAFKIAYYFTNISGIALPYGSKDDPVYGEETAKSLGTIPVFLFHVPDDKELLHKLVRKSSVRVMLVGRDLSLNRFDITSCK